jgi:hypothetical protein
VTGLTSTTPVSTGAADGTSIVLAASPGNLLFAVISNANSFTSPTGITNRTTISGEFGSVLTPADATLTSAQISGGDVTVTNPALRLQPNLD